MFKVKSKLLKNTWIKIKPPLNAMRMFLMASLAIVSYVPLVAIVLLSILAGLIATAVVAFVSLIITRDRDWETSS